MSGHCPPDPFEVLEWFEGRGARRETKAAHLDVACLSLVVELRRRAEATETKLARAMPVVEAALDWEHRRNPGDWANDDLADAIEAYRAGEDPA